MIKSLNFTQVVRIKRRNICDLAYLLIFSKYCCFHFYCYGQRAKIPLHPWHCSISVVNYITRKYNYLNSCNKTTFTLSCRLQSEALYIIDCKVTEKAFWKNQFFLSLFLWRFPPFLFFFYIGGQPNPHFKVSNNRLFSRWWKDFGLVLFVFDLIEQQSYI